MNPENLYSLRNYIVLSAYIIVYCTLILQICLFSNWILPAYIIFSQYFLISKHEVHVICNFIVVLINRLLILLQSSTLVTDHANQLRHYNYTINAQGDQIKTDMRIVTRCSPAFLSKLSRPLIFSQKKLRKIKLKSS